MFLYYLLLVVTVMPYHPLFIKTLGPFTITKLVGILTLLWVAFLIPWRADLLRVRPLQPIWFFLYYVVMMISSLIRGPGFSFGDFTKLLALFSLSIIVPFVINSPRALRQTILVLAAATAVSSLYVAKQYYAWRDLYTGFRTWGGPSGDPNYYALAVVMWMPLFLVWMFNTKSAWERILMAGSLAANLFGLMLVASRGGFVALMAAVGVLILRSRQRLRILIAVVMALPILLLAPSSPLSRLLSPSKGDLSNADTRVVMWAAARDVFLDNPLLGVGAERLPDELKKHESMLLNLSAVHNTYLECAGMYGLSGLIPFLALLLTVYRNLGRSARKPYSGTPLSRMMLPLQSGMAAYAFGSIFLSTWWHLICWLLIFVSTSVTRLREMERAGTAPWLQGGPEQASSWLAPGYAGSPAPAHRL